jgi:hypothetical protein
MIWAPAIIFDSDVREVDGETTLVVWLRQEDGREVEDNIVLESPNRLRAEAGKRQLAALCRSAGWWETLSDSDCLHERRCYMHMRHGRVTYWPASVAFTAGAA